MANTVFPTSQPPQHGLDEKATMNRLMAVVTQVQANPWPYIGAIGFVVLVLIVTGIYRASQSSAYTAAADEFARALDIEEPVERAAALGALAEKDTALTARALYLQAEAELEAGNEEAAKTAFASVRERFPDFDFAPESVEGLALIAEDAGDIAGARALYEEVVAKWPNTPAAMRQPFNIARCLEAEGQMAQAVERYRDQLEVFPGSSIAARAQIRLDELRVSNPELFPADPVAEAPAIQELQTAPDALAAPEAETAPVESESAPTEASAPTESSAETPE